MAWTTGNKGLDDHKWTLSKSGKIFVLSGKSPNQSSLVLHILARRAPVPPGNQEADALAL